MFSCEKCNKEFTERRNLLRIAQSTEAYTCDVCGKDFDREDARNRHMKTHLKDATMSGQTYSCGVCGKEFSRADNRNRHEAAHSYSLTCGVCGQYFNRLDILARHRAQHERPEAKQRLPMKRPAAPEPGPSQKQRRIVLPPAKTHQEKSGVAADMEVLPDDPETRALHRQHWQSIRTEEATGNRIQDRYNFTLHEMTASTFPEMVRYLYRQQTTAFKINLSWFYTTAHRDWSVAVLPC